MGSIGASASSEAADVVILVDQVGRVSDAVNIAKQTRKIAVQSIGAGMALSGIAMGFAAIGWLPPVAGALTQEVIDVAVILNALRALKPHWKFKSMVLKPDDVKTLREDYEILESSLDQLRRIADKLDGVDLDDAITLIKDASGIVREKIVSHEIEDELFPSLGKKLASSHALISMSRSHKEIRHLTRMLERISEGISSNEVDRYLIRDAQRIIESIETVVRLHTAQEEDLYEALSH